MAKSTANSKELRTKMWSSRGATRKVRKKGQNTSNTKKKEFVINSNIYQRTRN